MPRTRSAHPASPAPPTPLLPLRPPRGSTAELGSVTPVNDAQLDKVRTAKGFIAALDQSGGSTPKALKLYGIEESEYSGDDEMFAKVHEMRSRIIKSPSFTG